MYQLIIRNSNKLQWLKVKATTNPVLAVLRSTFCIGRHGSGFPSRLSLAKKTNRFHLDVATHQDSFVAKPRKTFSSRTRRLYYMYTDNIRGG